MAIDRHSLADWLLPHCEPGTASVMYPKGKRDGPGWVNGEADVARAIAAYRAGALGDEKFSSITQDGKKYVIAGGTLMGLVPHRDGTVARFCMDFDDHDGDGGNVHLAEAVDHFLGATSIKFSSKSGKGLHCYYALAEPLEVDKFVEWAKAWGFNKRGDIECFPKTQKRTQVWLPNEPNDQGGDTYRGGSLEDAVVDKLPPAPTRRLNKATLDFLRGFVAKGYRNDALNKAAYHCAKQRMPESEAGKLCGRASGLCGLLDEEADRHPAVQGPGRRDGPAVGMAVPEGDRSQDPGRRVPVGRGAGWTRP